MTDWGHLAPTSYIACLYIVKSQSMLPACLNLDPLFPDHQCPRPQRRIGCSECSGCSGSWWSSPRDRCLYLPLPWETQGYSVSFYFIERCWNYCSLEEFLNLPQKKKKYYNYESYNSVIPFFDTIPGTRYFNK
jgi:hypothetical protein